MTSNPKHNHGSKKASMSAVPCTVLMELGLAMMEGARKYGAHNWRASAVVNSIYFDATLRHLFAFQEGEDNDPDSGINHLTKAMAALTVWRDAMIQGKLLDDRPIRSNNAWIDVANNQAEDLIVRHPDPVAPFTEIETWARS